MTCIVYDLYHIYIYTYISCYYVYTHTYVCTCVCIYIYIYIQYHIIPYHTILYRSRAGPSRLGVELLPREPRAALPGGVYFLVFVAFLLFSLAYYSWLVLFSGSFLVWAALPGSFLIYFSICLEWMGFLKQLLLIFISLFILFSILFLFNNVFLLVFMFIDAQYSYFLFGPPFLAGFVVCWFYVWFVSF